MIVPAIGMTLTGGVQEPAPGSTPTVPGWVVPVQFGLMAALALAALAVKAGPRGRGAGRGALTDLRAPSRGPAALIAIGSGAGVMFALAWQLLIVVTSGQDSSRAVTSSLSVGSGAVRDILLILGVAALAPLGEELVFRGMIFRGLGDTVDRSRRDGLWSPGVLVGAGVSALLFAAAHAAGGQAKQFLPLLVLGLVACVVYQLTGSLATAVVFHSVSNAIGLGFMLFTGGGPGQPWHLGVIVLAPVLTVVLLILLRQLRSRRP